MKFKNKKNYCSRLYKKARRKYFQNLNPRRISYDKIFSKNIQLLSATEKISNKINISDNKENTIFEGHLVSFQRNLINF